MGRYKNNFLVIHLNKFKSIEEFNQVLEDNDISKVCPKSLYAMKLEGYTKVFLDNQTHEMFAFSHTTLKGKIKFCDEFEDMLKTERSIDFDKKPKNISINSILDKINEKGINSLNRYEKEFLENNK